MGAHLSGLRYQGVRKPSGTKTQGLNTPVVQSEDQPVPQSECLQLLARHINNLLPMTEDETRKPPSSSVVEAGGQHPSAASSAPQSPVSAF